MMTIKNDASPNKNGPESPEVGNVVLKQRERDDSILSVEMRVKALTSEYNMINFLGTQINTLAGNRARVRIPCLL